jgi:hypothetical protein
MIRGLSVPAEPSGRASRGGHHQTDRARSRLWKREIIGACVPADFLIARVGWCVRPTRRTTTSGLTDSTHRELYFYPIDLVASCRCRSWLPEASHEIDSLQRQIASALFVPPPFMPFRSPVRSGSEVFAAAGRSHYSSSTFIDLEKKLRAYVVLCCWPSWLVGTYE